jgi:hypothetical protein
MYINYNDLCPPPLSDFLEYLIAIKGRADKTVSQYFLDLRTFYRFLVMRFKLSPDIENFEEIDISPVTLDVIIENTLHISELTVSESIYKEIKNEVELIEEIPEWSFDLNGKILI